ncbi:MAG: hypothetical protein OXH00_21585 [Candidatus Poribacteria bacterium]|nr:hypothetical protein [Candidatus Poribacteria bacterium]
MNEQLHLFPLNRAELEKELKDREGLFWLFMVYFPKDGFYPPDATQEQREKAEAKGKTPIPQHHWDKALKNAKRINEIRETLNTIGK